MYDTNNFYQNKRDGLVRKINWQLAIGFCGEKFVAAWVNTARPNDPDPNSNNLVVFKEFAPDQLEEIQSGKHGRTVGVLVNPLADQVSAAAKAFAISQVRDLYPPAEYFYFPKKDKVGFGGFPLTSYNDIVVDLFLRSQAGEYIGQSNQFLYVQDVAAILKFDFQETYKIVATEIANKRLGLNGNILISYSEMKADQEYLLKETGHRDYYVIDFTSEWGCKACGAFSSFDDDKGPNDIECNPRLI